MLLDEKSHTRVFINELAMILILSAHICIIHCSFLHLIIWQMFYSHGILTKHKYTHFVFACIYISPLAKQGCMSDMYAILNNT